MLHKRYTAIYKLFYYREIKRACFDTKEFKYLTQEIEFERKKTLRTHFHVRMKYI